MELLHLVVAGRRPGLPMIVCCSSRDELDAVCSAVSNLADISFSSLVTTVLMNFLKFVICKEFQYASVILFFILWCLASYVFAHQNCYNFDNSQSRIFWHVYCCIFLNFFWFKIFGLVFEFHFKRWLLLRHCKNVDSR